MIETIEGGTVTMNRAAIAHPPVARRATIGGVITATAGRPSQKPGTGVALD